MEAISPGKGGFRRTWPRLSRQARSPLDLASFCGIGVGLSHGHGPRWSSVAWPVSRRIPASGRVRGGRGRRGMQSWAGLGLNRAAVMGILNVTPIPFGWRAAFWRGGGGGGRGQADASGGRGYSGYWRGEHASGRGRVPVGADARSAGDAGAGGGGAVVSVDTRHARMAAGLDAGARSSMMSRR